MARGLSSREIIQRLERDGWYEARVAGSHHQFRHPNKQGRVTVVHPLRDIPIKTVRNIFRQAGWRWPPDR